MAIEFGKGIALAGGFDLGAKAPLDSRLTVATIEERDAHVTGNRAYEGMLVYVEADKITYQYVADAEGNLSWKEFGFNEINFDYVRFPDRTGTLEKNGTINLNNTYDEEKGKGILYEVETVFKGSFRALRGISLLAMVYLQRKVDGVPFWINLCKMVCDTPYSHWKLSVQRKEK